MTAKEMEEYLMIKRENGKFLDIKTLAKTLSSILVKVEELEKIVRR